MADIHIDDDVVKTERFSDYTVLEHMQLVVGHSLFNLFKWFCSDQFLRYRLSLLNMQYYILMNIVEYYFPGVSGETST